MLDVSYREGCSDMAARDSTVLIFGLPPNSTDMDRGKSHGDMVPRMACVRPTVLYCGVSWLLLPTTVPGAQDTYLIGPLWCTADLAVQELDEKPHIPHLTVSRS